MGWVNLFVTNVKAMSPAERNVSNSPCYVTRIQKCLQSMDTVCTVPHLIIPILFLCHRVLSYTQSKAENPSLSQFPFRRYYDKESDQMCSKKMRSMLWKKKKMKKCE